MDPLNSIPVAQRSLVYAQWRDAAHWVLDTCGPRGAKVTFLACGEYHEYTLEDPAKGYPLIQRLYASGGSIGTHSHDEKKYGSHDWRSIGMTPPINLVVAAWDDHVNAANAVIAAALGITDPAAQHAVNNTRGTHIPADDTIRIDLMRQYGFTMHQQGPEEDFYAYFKHYVMNPYRPSGARFLSHDPGGPVVVTPFGPVLGVANIHKGVYQDMRLPAVQGRFLLELLNWLHDVHVAHSGRVWVTGWAAHGSDVMPGTATRAAVAPMLDWVKANFVDEQVGGQQAAAFASARECRDLYYAWEAAHPGQPSFSYAADATDWTLYPYLRAAAYYLTDAQYVSSIPAVGRVRGHALTAAAAVGGPYTMHVVYTTDGVPATADLSGSLGSGDIAIIDPATGRADMAATTAITVPAVGAILVPTDKVLGTPGDFDHDGDVDLGDFVWFQACFNGPNRVAAVPALCAEADFDADGDVDLADFSRLLACFNGPNQPPNCAGPQLRT